MSLSVNIDIEQASWSAAIPDLEQITRETAQSAWNRVCTKGNDEVSILFSNDDTLRDLNRRFRGKDKPTNVLSFPCANAPAMPPMMPRNLGDIAISFETVSAEAARDDKPLQDHIRHMIVHGLLHLLGHDHETDREAEAMESLERDILLVFGVSDPYLCTSEVF
jgi:probable rRNA maturation factor